MMTPSVAAYRATCGLIIDSSWNAIFVATKMKSPNKDEKHLPQILCRSIGMFVK